MFLFSTAVLGSMYLLYRSLEQKESLFVRSFSKHYGEYLDSVSLGSLSINGKDSLSWGAKLYLYGRGLVIGTPQDPTTILVPLNNIQAIEYEAKSVKLTYITPNSLFPFTLELGGNPLGKNISKALQDKLNTEVLSC